VYFPNTSIPVAYCLCDVDGKFQQYIEKRFIMHVFDRYWPEQRRGLPLFYPSLNNLRDIMQSEEWERMNLLSMSSLNYTVENLSGGPDPEDPTYVPGDCGKLAAEYLQGGRIMYAKAGAGEKITQHQNFRPGNPWHEFYDMQARQCLVGACLPATLWKPSGQGTAQREDIGKACRFVEDRQSTLAKIAKWRVTKAVAWAMENERVPKIQQWWNWSFTTPPKLTIDDGRSLKEKMALYDKGLINATQILGELSLDLGETLKERATEEAKRLVAIREANEEYEVEIDPRGVRLITASEQPQQSGDTSNDSEDGDDSGDESNNDKLRFENLKAKFDAYGVAVRAGAITPAKEDEDLFRKEAGLPSMPKAVAGAWQEDKGYRRPITLAQKGAPASPFNQPQEE
jgi:hypothetical protein